MVLHGVDVVGVHTGTGAFTPHVMVYGRFLQHECISLHVSVFLFLEITGLSSFLISLLMLMVFCHCCSCEHCWMQMEPGGPVYPV